MKEDGLIIHYIMPSGKTEVKMYSIQKPNGEKGILKRVFNSEVMSQGKSTDYFYPMDKISILDEELNYVMRNPDFNVIYFAGDNESVTPSIDSGPSPEILAFRKKMFPKEEERKERGLCPFCSKEIDFPGEFNTPLSLREFEISGMCQKCQDDFFRSDDED